MRIQQRHSPLFEGVWLGLPVLVTVDVELGVAVILGVGGVYRHCVSIRLVG